MCGMTVVAVACDHRNVDLADLEPRRRVIETSLAALMITYPSTHGVFEEGVAENMRDRPCAWRPGLYGRREYECAGRAVPARLISGPTSAI